jgi:hypothetical protein
MSLGKDLEKPALRKHFYLLIFLGYPYLAIFYHLLRAITKGNI